MASSNFHDAKICPLPPYMGVAIQYGQAPLAPMATQDLHLSVHLGPRWTAAVASTGGRAWPVTFDGRTRIPSGVSIDARTGSPSVASAAPAAATTDAEGYLPDPLTALRTTSAQADP